jgi:hypothetical protein
MVILVLTSLSSQKKDPGSRILALDFFHPKYGARIQGSKKRRISDSGSKYFSLHLHLVSKYAKYFSLHLELQISPRIFEKIKKSLNGILRGLGETDS